jgi:hypothetical protein
MSSRVETVGDLWSEMRPQSIQPALEQLRHP